MPKKRARAPKPPAFQFITSTGDPGEQPNDPEVGRAIRSHVMRRFRHENRKDSEGGKGRQIFQKSNETYLADESLQDYLNQGKDTSIKEEGYGRVVRGEDGTPSYIYSIRNAEITHPKDSAQRVAYSYLPWRTNNEELKDSLQRLSDLILYSPRTMLDSARSDPFNSLPIHWNSQTELLLYFCQFKLPLSKTSC
jgi:hypothetical protein